MTEHVVTCGDARTHMPLLDDESVDLVVTSPPYNVGLGDNKFNKDGYDIHNDSLPEEEYLKLIESVFAHIFPKLCWGGRVAINIGDGKNGKISTHVTVSSMMQRMGYLPMATIIWDKKHTSNRTAWGSWMSPSCPSFPSTFEYILIFTKGFFKLQTKGETDLTREEFIEWTKSIWQIPGVKKSDTQHPAAFPLELPTRLVKMLSWRGALVLDPFCGSGTTGIAAKQHGRRFVGFDISENYCKIARQRIENAIPNS